MFSSLRRKFFSDYKPVSSIESVEEIAVNISPDAKNTSSTEKDLLMILNKLNSSNNTYSWLKKINQHCTINHKIGFLVLTGSAILSLKFLNDSLNAYDAYEEDLNVFKNFLNGTCYNITMGLHCSLLENITHACSSLKDKICSDRDNESNVVIKILFSAATFLGSILYTCYTFEYPTLTINDLLETNELALLNKQNILSNTDINTACESIKLLMETITYRDILTQPSWNIIKSYLEPLETKEFNQKAKDEADRELTDIHKWDSETITEKAQADAKEAELLETFFKELTGTNNEEEKKVIPVNQNVNSDSDDDEPDVKEENISQEMTAMISKHSSTFYPTVLSHIHRAQVLKEKGKHYYQTAEKQLSDHYSAEIDISSTKKIQAAQKNVAACKNTLRITKATQSKISLFVQNSLPFSKKLESELNKTSDVDSNTSALKILNFLI